MSTESVRAPRLLRLRNSVLRLRASRNLDAGLLFGAGGTGILRIAFTALSFLINVLLARLLSPAGYGSYSYALAIVGVLSVFAAFGMDALLTREMAVYRARKEWGRLHGLLRRSAQAGTVLSLSLAFAASVAVWLLRSTLPRETVLTVWIGLALLPLFVLGRLRQSAMQGLQHLLAGQIPELLLQPLFLLALLAGTYALRAASPSAPWVIALSVLASTVAVIIGARLLQRAIPSASRAAAPQYETAAWIRSALPFLLSSSCWVISARADVLLLGALRGNDAVGLYSVASRSAELIGFFLTAFNVALAPTIAQLYTAGDLPRLQQTVTRGARIVFLLSLPVALGFFLYGEWWLRLYGQEFMSAHTTLSILAIGQIVNVGTGSVGVLLNMTGHERDAAALVAVAAAWNVIGSAVMISLWGVEGAACATTLGLILWNVLMAVRIHQRTGIHPTALGVLAFGRGSA